MNISEKKTIFNTLNHVLVVWTSGNVWHIIGVLRCMVNNVFLSQDIKQTVLIFSVDFYLTTTSLLFLFVYLTDFYTNCFQYTEIDYVQSCTFENLNLAKQNLYYYNINCLHVI